MFSKIQIPKDLLPEDGRFGCGPSRIRPEFLHRLLEIQTTYLGTSHRKPGVKNRVGHVFELLRSFFRIPEDYKIAGGNGSASIVWDMITFGLVEKQSLHFVNGEFSSKWYKSASMSNFIESGKIEAAPGDLPAFQEDPNYDVHCITWNETSTGVMYPCAPKCKDSLLAVDATSAAGCLHWDQPDLFYFSPQKALGSEGGLWIGFFSPRCIEQIERVKKTNRYIPAMLDFTTALSNGESNQTYNTPSLVTLYLLEQQLEYYNELGMERIEKDQEEKFALMERWVESRPELSFYVKNPEHRSKTTVTINLVKDIPHGDLCTTLRSHGILDIEAYRKLGENQIRIALFPNISKTELEKLIASINYLLDKR